MKKPSDMTRREFVTASTATLAIGTVAPKLWAQPIAEQQPDRGPSRVIIDTDPGVDDAFALLLAMRSPELKIEASRPLLETFLWT